jgi:hypothetical protein
MSELDNKPEEKKKPEKFTKEKLIQGLKDG